MIIGIDPGLKKSGICIYDEVQDYVVELYTSNSAIEALMECLENIKTDSQALYYTVAIEAFEPQPWRTGGKVPRGAKAMYELVETLSVLARDVYNVRTYVQSPSVIARELRDIDVKTYLKVHKEVRNKVNKHERDALKHALYCAAKLIIVRLKARS